MPSPTTPLRTQFGPDVWGAIRVPLDPIVGQQPAGDPCLYYLGTFLRAFLSDDENVTAQWQVAGIAATCPPVKTVMLGVAPDDKGYAYKASDLTTLFLFRESQTLGFLGDGIGRDDTVLKIVWMLPQGQPQNTRVRLPFQNALVKAMWNAVERGRTPCWQQPGDVDPNTPTQGSLLYRYAAFAHLRCVGAKPALFRMRNVKGETVGSFPGIETTWELMEDMIPGITNRAPLDPNTGLEIQITDPDNAGAIVDDVIV